MCDTDLADYNLATNALDGSILRMLRPGQRVLFTLDEHGNADDAAPRLGDRHEDARPLGGASRRGGTTHR
ncbi:MAG: hypothetical protein WKF58_05790 [Ilumatobacteraceae bacterium]